MSHRQLAAGFTVVLAALMMPCMYAQDQSYQYSDSSQPMLMPSQLPSPAVGMPPYYGQSVSYRQPVGPTGPAPTPIDADQAQASAPVPQPIQQPGYVRLGAPMYPTPRPNIPAWTGSTVITNQAFAPQEMLYPHTYRAIYPPYYHRVKGGWILTPFGVRSHEKWELQGTMVQVKYRSSYPGLFSGAYWHPPITSNVQHGSWR
ncbi:hypothetical protein [Schlesneria paludicola]|uniref:hypothetical protein n=1 Tax=Schlesneria paludicola TaxID=360056 RepID=UPI00029B23CE|nr:hypothetical protein [Schlesneria paludicola]